jgi:hypothetical protein
MFSSVPSSNIDDLLYLIHSKHSFLFEKRRLTQIIADLAYFLCGNLRF